MRALVSSLAAGVLFGFGLGLSQMIDPARITGFLDVFGAWDPTLMFVLGGAVGTTALTFRLVLRRAKPVCEPEFLVPKRTSVDRRLVTGSALFGIGWGLTGYCPGPGITGLVLGSTNALFFVAAFAIGLIVSDKFIGEPAAEKKSEDG
ncbi:MAG TPA: YeeE/YedE family protein [Kiritimatiellia bacterium]|nr:YeeE/YedE family protein [Kiritimatiellia bacterium]HMO97915.1 YeeE/YedE family protein [Kiritimatiellia bacterium]HMP95566.1 YeeE/YedE family protein [Kiritimatiellia bacterium]